MEIDLMKCILIGLWAAFCMTGMLTGTYLTRCLVMSAGVGVILGDINTGLIMGAVGELAFLGFGVSSGGTVPPNPAGPGIVGTVLAITMKQSGMDTEAALAYSFPFALLIQFLITGIFTISSGLAEKARKAVIGGRFISYRFLANGTMLMFAAAGFGMGFAAASQAQRLGRLLSLIPEGITGGLSIGGKMLPAVGFAVILSAMCGWDTGPFVMLGYVAAAYIDMPVLGIALLAAALAWATLNRREGEKETAEKNIRGTEVFAIQEDGEKAEKESITQTKPTGVRQMSWKRLRQLSRSTAMRAYFLQNGYNYGNYEGLSYSFVVFPALKKLFPKEEDLKREIADSMSFCSVNPNFLPILTSFHLITLNRGMYTRESRDLRTAMMGPLAGIGDSLIQFCIAPVMSTIGAGLAQKSSMAGPVIFLLGMNGILLGLKLANEALGFRLGRALARKMEKKAQLLSHGARMVGCSVVAGLCVTGVEMRAAITFEREGEMLFSLQNFLDTLMPGILPAMYTGTLFYLMKRKKWSMNRLVALTLSLGILFHLLGVLE
nr:PTS system mannose/fructose/sorbose family transporter subunit IID [uncultured Acetatifactor sp.]